MKCFFVDGSQKNLADVILENTIVGKTCAIISYGFGVAQIQKLLSRFEQVLLIADSSHSTLNTRAYNKVVELSNLDNGFTFKPIRTHAKLVIIDNETLIFTSANLSANRRMESYLIGNIKEISGIDEICKVFGNPEDIFSKEKNIKSVIDLSIDIDFDIDLKL